MNFCAKFHSQFVLPLLHHSWKDIECSCRMLPSFKRSAQKFSESWSMSNTNQFLHKLEFSLLIYLLYSKRNYGVMNIINKPILSMMDLAVDCTHDAIITHISLFIALLGFRRSRLFRSEGRRLVLGNAVIRMGCIPLKKKISPMFGWQFGQACAF